MLDVAKSRCDGARVTCLAQSFTGLDLPEEVDLLTCNFDSLNYLLEEDDLREALTRFARALKPGGCAIFDMNTARELEAGLGEAVLLHRTTAGMSVWESSWDAEARTNTVVMTNFLRRADGLYTATTETHVERCYDLDKVLGFLKEAGFRSVEAFDAKGLAATGPETRRVQFLAFR